MVLFTNFVCTCVRALCNGARAGPEVSRNETRTKMREVTTGATDAYPTQSLRIQHSIRELGDQPTSCSES